MELTQARDLIEETFRKAFDKPRFLNFIRNLLNHFDESKAISMQIPDAFAAHIRSCRRLGTYESPEGELADVLIVNTTEAWKLERTRTGLRDFVAHKLKRGDSYKEAGLIAFVSPDALSWRFSFVRMEYQTKRDETTGKIAVEETVTPARRFSYIVGEGESCHTAQTRFVELLTNTNVDPSLADIETAFSVEAVTKEFFNLYAELFNKLDANLERLAKRQKTVAAEFKATKISTVDFAKKLLGQIVFLYFLQKKGWLGVEKGKDWGDGPRDFLRRLADRKYVAYDNFFNDVLEPLFYDTLATDRGHDAWCKTLNCRIPFLNGGLFEPLGDYDWRKTEIVLPNTLFTNTEHVEKTGDNGTGILDMFDRYNFTVNEAEPLEKEVAIDPEMLGKVFENLIEENRRKGLGSYYTPREIVHYMCQESLINYLDTAVNTVDESVLSVKPKQPKLLGAPEPEQIDLRTTGTTEVVPRADLETFVHLGDQISHYEAVETEYRIKMPKSIIKNAKLIDEKLKDITVCDPAVGSGAFPVGMMNEIVRCRSALTTYFNDVDERTPYHFKRHAIQNCLYGVDIDPGAVEIAKLRLWLSLVVDEEDVKQIKPLPNLFYKIVTGNSLIGFPFKSQGLTEIERLKDWYFSEPDHDKKAELKQEIDKKLAACFASSKKALGYEVDFDFEIYFSEVFRRGGGFNITLGNPPYVRADAEGYSVLRKTILDSHYYETLWEKWDLFVPFIERSYKLLRPGGVTTMIVSDAFCHSKYAQKPQKWFLANARVLRLDFCTDLQIFEAAVHNVIYFFQKANGATNVPIRRVHHDQFGSVTLLSSDQQERLTYRAFFPDRTARQEFAADTVRLNRICYVTKGMVVHANEEEARGAFELVDLVADKKDAKHPKPFVEGKHLDRWFPAKHKWLEFGTRRAPALFSRPTFPQIYSVPEKLISVDMAAGVEKLRVAYDDQQLLHNHSAWSFVPWHLLHGVRNNSLKKVARYRNEKPRPDLPKREQLEETSRRFSVKYLLGVMNSSAARDFLRANRRSNIHLYPDDWKQLPIPDVPLEEQRPVEQIVNRILTAKAKDASADISALEKELDGRVYELYGLTNDEIAIVEDIL